MYSMKKSSANCLVPSQIFFTIIALLFAYAIAEAKEPVKASVLIPRPLHCIDQEGYFTIHPRLKISAPAAFTDASKLLGEGLTGTIPVWVSAIENPAVVFERVGTLNGLEDEGYELSISPEKISIKAITLKGALNAVFSLLQLQLLQADMTFIPCAEIRDTPRFEYRGMHLDVSRNFFPVSFIKKYIDLMA